MKSCLRKDDELLDDIKAAEQSPHPFHVWWLGQSGFLVQWQGHHLLIDPYLSDSLTQKYAETDKPHVRITERVIDPARLDFIDLVTSSHNHTDHLDGETLTHLLQANPNLVITVPAANRAFAAQRLDVQADRLTPIDAGQSLIAGGFSMHALPAAHNELDQDEEGRYKYLGYIFNFGEYAIYHSGDTLLYEGLADQLKTFNIDLAILPINGNKPERRVAGNLNAVEAAELAEEIGAGCVVPCHYDMFEFNTADPAEFAEECEALGQPHTIMQCGERWSA